MKLVLVLALFVCSTTLASSNQPTNRAPASVDSEKPEPLAMTTTTLARKSTDVKAALARFFNAESKKSGSALNNAMAALRERHSQQGHARLLDVDREDIWKVSSGKIGGESNHSFVIPVMADDSSVSTSAVAYYDAWAQVAGKNLTLSIVRKVNVEIR